CRRNRALFRGITGFLTAHPFSCGADIWRGTMKVGAVFCAIVAAGCRQFVRFRTDERGNVAIIFGLALLPVAGMVGAALDCSRANSVKAAMQASLDATALLLTRDAETLTPSQLNKKARDYFKAEFHRPEAVNINIKPHYASNGVLLDLTL